MDRSVARAAFAALGVVSCSILATACGVRNVSSTVQPEMQIDEHPDKQVQAAAATSPVPAQLAPGTSTVGSSSPSQVPQVVIQPNAMDGLLSHDRAIGELVPGTYLLYLEEAAYPVQDEWELRYTSIDGRRQGILVRWKSQPVLLGLAGTSVEPELLVAAFEEDGLATSVINLASKESMDLSVHGVPGSIPSHELSEQTGTAVGASSSAFSPDGNWLVWDCPQDGHYAWCLLDLTRLEVAAILPGGDPMWGERLHPGNYIWYPDGSHFLAVCSLEGQRSSPLAWCLVDPNLGTVERWKDIQWSEDNTPEDGIYFPKSVSPDGEWLALQSRSGHRFLAVDCVPDGSCATPKEVGVPAGDSVWIPGGEGLAVTPWTVTDRPGGGSQLGHTDVEVIDPNTLVTTHLMSRGPRALYARGWSPDGEWLALWSDPENPWRVYLLSRDGVLRGIVPMTNATYIGWFEVE